VAGIGFKLRELSQRGTVGSMLAAAGHAAVIAAGPWMFTIVSLAVITLVGDTLTGPGVLADFRAIVIYAFAVSLIFSAPVTIVATRLVSDALWQRRAGDVAGLFLASSVIALVPVGGAVTLLALAFKLALPVAAALCAMSLVITLIWVAVAFCGAVRDYRGVSRSFALGLVVAIVAVIGVVVGGKGVATIAWAFIAGLVVIHVGLVARVIETFPQPVQDPDRAMRMLLGGHVIYWPLALGALFAAFGGWVDKIVFWFSPEAEAVASGLRHAPLYDSAMFIASLTMIPPLAALVSRLETHFFERYQQYYATISGHGTLANIEVQRERLQTYTQDALTGITITQVGLAGILVLTAPIIIDALGLQFRQITILRYGAIGGVFHFVFIAATALLLFFDRRMLFLAAQILFFALNGALSIVTVMLGPSYYGVGYFLAALGMGVVVYFLVERTLAKLNYLTFVGNNPSVQQFAEKRRFKLDGFRS
jgi:uncharacterized membrane protein